VNFSDCSPIKLKKQFLHENKLLFQEVSSSADQCESETDSKAAAGFSIG
jgi:hypothetical protein